jgi:hypothetical protein
MSNSTAPHRWYHGWRASPPPVAEQDPADLGTAFGLDLSLRELRHEAPDTANAHGQPGWMSRLTRRRDHNA